MGELIVKERNLEVAISSSGPPTLNEIGRHVIAVLSTDPITAMNFPVQNPTAAYDALADIVLHLKKKYGEKFERLMPDEAKHVVPPERNAFWMFLKTLENILNEGDTDIQAFAFFALLWALNGGDYVKTFRNKKIRDVKGFDIWFENHLEPVVIDVLLGRKRKPAEPSPTTELRKNHKTIFFVADNFPPPETKSGRPRGAYITYVDAARILWNTYDQNSLVHPPGSR